MHVYTDHQIAAFGPDRMLLLDSDAANVLVDAQRNSEGVWIVSAPNVNGVSVNADKQPNSDGLDGTATYRRGAIDAMIAQALASLPGSGYSTTVPHGLAETP